MAKGKGEIKILNTVHSARTNLSQITYLVYKNCQEIRELKNLQSYLASASFIKSYDSASRSQILKGNVPTEYSGNFINKDVQ